MKDSLRAADTHTHAWAVYKNVTPPLMETSESSLGVVRQLQKLSCSSSNWCEVLDHPLVLWIDAGSVLTIMHFHSRGDGGA